MKRGDESWQKVFRKKCGCGKSYGAYAWLSLKRAGVIDDGEDLIEIRQCSCGSTIGYKIGKSKRK